MRLAYITATDFIVRSAYQMGKSPLLPVFAAALGAGGTYLGVIVAVSTLTGIVLKPLVGALADRWGVGVWLWGGAALFVGIPFLYGLVHTPGQLFALRLAHGLATAIYGPVTLAFVAQLGADGKRAERLGWFGLGRSGGYIVGPAVAGWLLGTLQPVEVYTIIGVVSCLAFLPLALLGPLRRSATPASSLREQLRCSLGAGARTGAVWLAGGLDSVAFIALYAVKAFLPIYALASGSGIAMVGLFFSVQEGAHLLARAVMGRVGDRVGYRVAIGAGMALMAAALLVLTAAPASWGLLALAAMLGAAQALVFPATIALVAARIAPDRVGAGMGLVGALKNTGKVVGPVVGGLLVQLLEFQWMVRVMALLLLVVAGLVWLGVRTASPRESARAESARPA